jgi:ankyrin repeat protein
VRARGEEESARRDEAVVRLLFERGADTTLRDRYSRTALYWARHNNRAAVVALLEAHGANEDEDEDGEGDDYVDEDDEDDEDDE